MNEFSIKVRVPGAEIADMVERHCAIPLGITQDEHAGHMRDLRAEPDRAYEVEMKLGTEEVRRLVADADLAPELRARAEAYLASVEG